MFAGDTPRGYIAAKGKVLRGAMTAVFLHGLDRSSKGVKARWFRQNFPTMLIPYFTAIDWAELLKD